MADAFSFLGVAGMVSEDEARFGKMIAEYQRLRRIAHELDVQSATVHRRLADIERQLPDDFADTDEAPRDDPSG